MKERLMDAAVATVAVLAGAGVVYAGDWLLGVRLELFFGVSTFSPAWVLSLFFVPFVAGIVVSLIYGLGGKILAHASPLLVHAVSYYELYTNSALLEDGASLLPFGYWIFIVIVAVEFAAVGGVVGEIMVKKTYGRTGRTNLHRRQAPGAAAPESTGGGGR